jgi:hypothetical protein
MSQYPYPLAGDLILCRGRNNVRPNLFGQRIFRPTKMPKFSHVAVVADSTCAIHAQPRQGVHLVGLHELLMQSSYSNNWIVYRNMSIEYIGENNHIQLTLDISQAINYYLFQSYLFGVHIPELVLGKTKNRKSFCSQLAKQIYDRLGVNTGIKIKSETYVLPVDFQFAVKDVSLWHDVSDKYSNFFALAKRNEEYLKSKVDMERLSYSTRTCEMLLEMSMTKRLIDISDYTRKVESSTKKIALEIDKLGAEFGIKVSDKLLPPHKLEAIEKVLMIESERSWCAIEFLKKFYKKYKL